MELGCAFHCKQLRGSTQCVLNLLRTEGFLWPNHVRLVGKSLCSCTDNDSKAVAPVSKLEDVQKWTHKITNLTASSQLQQQILILLKIAERSKDKEAITNGVLRLLSVVERILTGDVGFVETSPNHCTKLSAEINMPYMYIGFLVGCHGKHIKPLINKHNVKKFCIKPSSNYEKSVVSFVGGRSDSSELIQVLQCRAENVVRQRKQHEKCVAAYRQRRFLPNVHEEEWNGPHISAKEAARDQFARKKEKVNRGVKHNPSPILHNSHCLNCLAPYTANSMQCSFHPGYIITKKQRKRTKKVWSCCGRRSVSGHATHEEHTRGCGTGLHNWRPHRSCAKRKPALLVQALDDYASIVHLIGAH